VANPLQATRTQNPITSCRSVDLEGVFSTSLERDRVQYYATNQHDEAKSTNENLARTLDFELDADQFNYFNLHRRHKFIHLGDP
jgi:hypothetical protein